MCDIKFIVFCNCLSDSLNISAQENCIHRQYVLYFILVVFHYFKVKTAVFWDVTPCSLVEVDQGFRGAYSLRHQGSEFSSHLDDGDSTYP
jgi:hypothetical protein